MEESNKVVLKVKYQKIQLEENKNEVPAMVTEWHIGRLIGAGIVVLMLIGLLIFLLSGETKESEKKPKVIVKASASVAAVLKPKVNAERTKPVIQTTVPINSKQPAQTIINEVIVASVEMKTNPEKFNNINIKRAVLVKNVINREPTGDIILPVVVSQNKAETVHYFTEITNMKGNVLYHQWLRDGQLMFERKINITGNRWRATTNKSIPYSNAGMWSVRLIDKEGIIFNEIDFQVIQQ